jgi:cell wall-associated NlpC family hydrolase
VTTQDLTPGLHAATRSVRQRVGAGLLRLSCCVALCAAGLPAFAQSASSQPAPAAQALLSAGTSSTATAAAPAAAPSSTHVRPIFGDIADLDPGTTITFDTQQKPGITDRIQGVLSKAMTLLGTPYRWGGENPDKGFDCSGLVGYVYRTVLGVDLPRVSRQMATTGQAVERTALAPGDLVFFGKRGRVNHVGIYVGEGRFLHAPSRGKDVRVDSLTSSYWSGRYMQGRRVAM